MLPPPLVRRLILAPVVVVFAVAFIVLSPALAILALTFGLAARSRPGRMVRGTMERSVVIKPRAAEITPLSVRMHCATSTTNIVVAFLTISIRG